jgi:hypothetical protein
LLAENARTPSTIAHHGKGLTQSAFRAEEPNAETA